MFTLFFILNDVLKIGICVLRKGTAYVKKYNKYFQN